MNKTTKKDFIGYEYKDLPVKQKNEAIYIDGYVNFGWTLEDIVPSPIYNEVILKFKRDRKIRNKTEITRLQRQFDAGINEINKMEFSKLLLPSIVAYGLGLIGTAFLTGSVFSYLGGLIALCILLAIPGFLGWGVPYFLYTKLSRKKALEIDPLIEQKFDEMYEVCEKAHSLLESE